MFIKVKNEVDHEVSVFNLNVFNEKHLEKNPYSELSHGNGGRVLFDTSSFQCKFEPVNIFSTYSNEYNHVVKYTAYISDD